MLYVPVEIPAEITVTASLGETPLDAAAATVTLLDHDRLDRLSAPSLLPLLRAIPSIAAASSGPDGSFSEVRIRGAEANHTLLVIDGIRANDPAAGNAPRFELLDADLFQRVEVVRGPQSAIWGSEALGGVIAVGGTPRPGWSALAEAGSFGQRRLALSVAHEGAHSSLAVSLAGQRADGIDSFDGSGDEDGFARAGARLVGSLGLSPATRLTLAGFAMAGRSAFDGTDPATYLRADTRDESRNRLAAGRLGLEHDAGALSLRAGLGLLGSSNRNLVDDAPVNDTAARRLTADALVHWRFDGAGARQRLSAAPTADGERFHARDSAFGGFTTQDRSRAALGLTAEWQADWTAFTANAALRHDRFNRFDDATTARLGVVARLAPRWSLAASAGQAIAQPSFFDLYGFFPGSFAGNPALRPERSNGVETALRFAGRTARVSLTAFAQRLTDEIVDVYDPATFLSSTANAQGASRRRGLEVEGQWSPSAALRLFATAALLDARQPGLSAGLAVRETRRPRWSGSLGADGEKGRWSYGLLAARTGARDDLDFDRFPAARVRLSPYWLASARLAYAVRPGTMFFARLANAFDTTYQDVVGYRTEGRSVHVGLRLR